MKMFGRTGGYYLFWTSAIYVAIAVYFAVYYKQIPTELIQLCWLCILTLPFVIPPLGRYFNLNVEWDRKMFDLFKKNKMPKNVVPFPAPKAVAPIPYIEPPKEKEKPAHTYYRLGLTDNNRVSFSMGYSEITMNAAGIDSMISLLETYRALLREEHGDE
jgi:hypothetical protein